MSVVGGRRPVSHRSNHKPPFRCSVRQDAQRRSAPGLAGSFATVHESGSKMEKTTAGTTASGMRHRPWLSKRPRGQGSPEKVHSDRTASTVVRDGLFQGRPSGFRGIPPKEAKGQSRARSGRDPNRLGSAFAGKKPLTGATGLVSARSWLRSFMWRQAPTGAQPRPRRLQSAP